MDHNENCTSAVSSCVKVRSTVVPKCLRMKLGWLQFTHRSHSNVKFTCTKQTTKACMKETTETYTKFTETKKPVSGKEFNVIIILKWNFNCNMDIYLVIFDNWQCMPFLLCSQNMTWAYRIWLLFQNIKNSMTATLLPVIITLMVRHYNIVINVYHSISEPYHLPMKPYHLIFKPYIYIYILPNNESLSLIFLNHTS